MCIPVFSYVPPTRIPSFRYDSKIIATFVMRQGKSSRWDHFGTIFWTFSPIVASVHHLLLSIIQIRMRKSILRSSYQISMIHHHHRSFEPHVILERKFRVCFVLLPFPIFFFSFTFSFLPFWFSFYSLRLVYSTNTNASKFGSWEKFDGPGDRRKTSNPLPRSLLSWDRTYPRACRI